MKELKFRVWGNMNFIPKMYNWKEVDAEFPVGLWELLDRAGEPANAWKIMQYTGLKDKQGNEIYEGDIIKWRNTIGDEIKDVVIWSELSHGFSVSRTPEVCCVLSGSDGSHIEVIGNIYENPELLKEPK